jgi:hypothetical protein
MKEFLSEIQHAFHTIAGLLAKMPEPATDIDTQRLYPLMLEYLTPHFKQDPPKWGARLVYALYPIYSEIFLEDDPKEAVNKLTDTRKALNYIEDVCEKMIVATFNNSSDVGGYFI